jgi:hypothetical protein
MQESSKKAVLRVVRAGSIIVPQTDVQVAQSDSIEEGESLDSKLSAAGF